MAIVSIIEFITHFFWQFFFLSLSLWPFGGVVMTALSFVWVFRYSLSPSNVSQRLKKTKKKKYGSTVCLIYQNPTTHSSRHNREKTVINLTSVTRAHTTPNHTIHWWPLWNATQRYRIQFIIQFSVSIHLQIARRPQWVRVRKTA